MPKIFVITALIIIALLFFAMIFVAVLDTDDCEALGGEMTKTNSGWRCIPVTPVLR